MKTYSKKSLQVLGAALGITLLPLAGHGADAEVKAEPTETPVARFVGQDALSSVSWYFVSDAPLRERQLAETILITQDGTAQHFALQIAGESLTELGADASYELKVYESPKRPEKSFITRNVVLTRNGTVRNGDGGWLVFPLGEELALTGSHYYTFAISFTSMAPGNKVVLSHSKGDPDGSFRWHRSGRDSWVASPMSLHYMLY